MNLARLMRRPSAYLPLAMSVAALATVLIAVAGGAARQPDEGAAAHIFQLLLGGQLPLVAWFAVRWLPRAAGPALLVLGMQLMAGLLALAPVYLFHL